MTKDQLQKFCATYDLRECLHRPHRDGEFIVACNGHIAIRVPVSDDLSDITPLEPRQIKVVISDVIQKAINPSQVFFQVPANIPPRVMCEHCGGTGNAYRCESCEGKGEFEHEGYDYDCKHCDGLGQVRDAVGPDDQEIACSNCNGTGQSPRERQPIAIGDAHFNANLLRLISCLPGIKVAPNGPTGTAYLTFDGGDGCIMPMRL